MNNIEEILEEFKAVLIRIEILIFFSKNPYTMDTVNKFSELLKRPPSNIAKGLDYFLQKGIVEKIGEGENAIYAYTSDIDIVSKIDEFIKALSQRRII